MRGDEDTEGAELAHAATAADSSSSPPHPDEMRRGQHVGRYVILRRLGAGGMGVVYEAHDPELDRRIAIKLIQASPGGGSGSASGAARLLREAQAIARVAHPNVIHVYDVGRVDDQVFVAMELVDGVTLRVWMGARRGWEETLAALRQAGEGLVAAHDAGLVHRDFKPENVLVDARGRVRVLDFGLARPTESPEEPSDPAADTQATPRANALAARVTSTGLFVGTPLYMAPEQHVGQIATAAADQFAFAVTAWEALYGVHPFRTGRVSASELALLVTRGEIAPPPTDARVPARVEQALRRALRVRPFDRWPSMNELLAALAPSARQRGKWIAGAVAIALVGIGVAYVATSAGDDPPPPSGLRSMPTPRQVTVGGNAGSPALSPDARSIAYASAETLVIQELATGARRELLDAPRLSDIRWSPDGSLLSFTAMLQDNLHMHHLIPATGGEPETVFGGQAVAWSPDGDRFAVVWQGTDRIDFIDARTRDYATAVRHRLGLPTPPAAVWDVDWWSADRLLFLAGDLRGERSLWSARADGTDAVLLADKVNAGRGSPRTSSVFVVNQEQQLVRLRVDADARRVVGPPEMLVEGVTGAGFHDLSASADKVVFVRAQATNTLRKVEISDAPLRMDVRGFIDRSGQSWTAQMSPDGRQLAYLSGLDDIRSELRVSDADGDNSRTLAAFEVPTRALAWSPDGSQLVIAVDRDPGKTSVEVIDVASTERRTVSVHADPVYELVWAPSREIYVKRGAAYLLLDPFTGAERALFAGERARWHFSAVFTPDATQLLYYSTTGARPAVMRLDLASGREDTVIEGEWLPLGCAGDRFVATVPVAETGTLELVRFSLARPDERESASIPIDGTVGGASLSADGRTMILTLVSFTSDVWMIDVPGTP